MNMTAEQTHKLRIGLQLLNEAFSANASQAEAPPQIRKRRTSTATAGNKPGRKARTTTETAQPAAAAQPTERRQRKPRAQATANGANTAGKDAPASAA